MISLRLKIRTEMFVNRLLLFKNKYKNKMKTIFFEFLKCNSFAL